MQEIWWWLGTTWKALTSSLYAEKAPYVVTLFIGAFCWIGIRTSDRLINNPFIEFQISHMKEELGNSNSVPRVGVRLRNITGDQVFRCFQLEVISTNGTTLGASSDDQLLVYLGSVGAIATVMNANTYSWIWEIENFAPSADLVLGIPQTGKILPKLLSRPCAAESASNAKMPGESMGRQRFPSLRERSFTTRYVEYEIFILWAGLLLWLMILILLNGLRSRTAASQTVFSRRQISRSRRLP